MVLHKTDDGWCNKAAIEKQGEEVKEPIPITGENLDKFFAQCKRELGFDEAFAVNELGMVDREEIGDIRAAWAVLKSKVPA